MAEEKTFTIPLRREWLKVPRWRRTKRAVSEIRTFVIKHAKTKEAKIGKWLNLSLWAKGAKNPPGKVTVNISKEKDVALVELAELPAKAKRITQQMTKKETEAKKREDAKKLKEEQKQKEEDYKKKKEVETKAVEKAKQAKITKEQEIAMHKS